MISVFISQAMTGLREEEILKRRSKAEEYIKSRFPKEKIQFVSSYFDPILTQLPYEVKTRDVYFLAKAIEKLSHVDYVYFVPSQELVNSKGCSIEFTICKLYDIKILNLIDKE